jgi:hypothetical protein
MAARILQHPAGRHDSGLRLRAGRQPGDCQFVRAGRLTAYSDRYGARAHGARPKVGGGLPERRRLSAHPSPDDQAFPFFRSDTERLPYADRFTAGIWISRGPADALPLVPFSFGPATCPGLHCFSHRQRVARSPSDRGDAGAGRARIARRGRAASWDPRSFAIRFELASARNNLTYEGIALVHSRVLT